MERSFQESFLLIEKSLLNRQKCITKGVERHFSFLTWISRCIIINFCFISNNTDNVKAKIVIMFSYWSLTVRTITIRRPRDSSLTFLYGDSFIGNRIYFNVCIFLIVLIKMCLVGYHSIVIHVISKPTLLCLALLIVDMIKMFFSRIRTTQASYI